jgi:SnoaL-like domain
VSGRSAVGIFGAGRSVADCILSRINDPVDQVDGSESAPAPTETRSTRRGYPATDMDTAEINARLLRIADQQEIRDVVYRYCRGIDRRNYALVRSCYHSDAVDDHGDFRGGVDEFIAYIQRGLPRFERTMHFIGNVLIESHGDEARSESYLVAYHRLAASRTKAERDYVVGLRYVDDFERRDDRVWRIAARVCVFEWSRIDVVAPGGWVPAGTATLGHPDGSDVVFAASNSRRLS